jgi:hypothetical protein
MEMGRSGQTRFVGHLVTLGWTEKNDQVRQCILASLDQLVPPENRPPTLGQTKADAKIKCWVEWWQKQQGRPVRTIPADAPLATSPDAAS